MTRAQAVRRAGAAFAALVAVSLPVPVSAVEPTTLWGVVPQSSRVGAVQVVSEKVGGERVGALPAPADGRFVFPNLAAGDYVVRVVDGTGQTVAQSQVARVQPETATEARFDDQLGPAPVFGGGGSGPSKALLIAGAAAIAGITTVVVIAADGPASPSR